MLRRLFMFLSMLSLLLCVATCVLWVRSYSGTDYLSRSQVVSSQPYAVITNVHKLAWTRGDVQFSVEEHTYYPHGSGVVLATQLAQYSRGRLGPGHVGWDDRPRVSIWNRLGFAQYESGWSSSFADEQTRILAFPGWLPPIVFALPTLAIARLLRRFKYRRTGLCSSCGYDLRASSERCPECGATATNI